MKGIQCFQCTCLIVLINSGKKDLILKSNNQSTFDVTLCDIKGSCFLISFCHFHMVLTSFIRLLIHDNPCCYFLCLTDFSQSHFYTLKGLKSCLKRRKGFLCGNVKDSGIEWSLNV